MHLARFPDLTRLVDLLKKWRQSCAFASDFDYGSKSDKMRAPNGMKSGWVMHEFRLENLHMPPKEEWVLCRVFHKGKEDLSSKKCLEYDTDDAIIGCLLAFPNTEVDQTLSPPSPFPTKKLVGIVGFGLVGDNVGILGERKTRFARTNSLGTEGENDGNLGLPTCFPARLRMGRQMLNITLQGKTNFGPEVDKVCKALEVYALKADLQWCASKCPCGNLSNIDHDADMWGFGDAWSEHHLQKGQGVGGRAFSSKSSCFSSDMTQLSK
ncbi:hypothetical protein IFM89_026688, partial [Coptis chinensis]